ncbi:MAG: sirohydrochlorin chelatase [Elainellaceae cyanobacterium]
MAASTRDAFLMVTHGSRDPRPGAAAEQLTQRLSRRLKCSHSASCQVVAAALECADRPLHQQILQVVNDRYETGIERLIIVPLFLLAGVHVREDVPHEVELARLALGDRLTLQLVPHLGQSPQMLPTLAQLFDARETGKGSPSRIVLAHGSRRAGGNQRVELLATQLQAIPAYWSTMPQLTEQVTHFVRAGQRQIMVLPYFLFPGGITDAIAQQVAQLQQRFPSLDLQTTPLLSESDGFESLVAGAMDYHDSDKKADLIPCNFH